MVSPKRMMLLFGPLALVACAPSDSDEVQDTSGAEAAMPDRVMMSEEGVETQRAGTTGTVVAIDNEQSSITIDHEPVPELEWPAMTMTFVASERHISSVSVGDRVEFEFEQGDEGSRISAIAKR